MKKNEVESASRLGGMALAILILIGATLEFFQVAWGTGNQLGEFSFNWAVIFLLFAGSCLGLLPFIFNSLYRPATLNNACLSVARLRDRLGAARWILVGLILIIPIAWIQFTTWGVVFTGIWFRLLLLSLMIFSCAIILAYSSAQVLTWTSFLAASLLCASVVAIAIPFTNVTSYPFSLGWSEGNRLWDYSMLFGRDLYTFSNGQTGKVYLDAGRQLIGGLPFLLPNVTIFQERFWVALTAILPYLLFGWCVFYLPKSKTSSTVTLLMSLWTLIFLRQGPIHAPLLLSATLVALTWRRPLPISLPSVVLASWFASISRFTWTFAPAIWMGMLALAGAPSEPSRRDWTKAILLGMAGALAGYFLPHFGGLDSGVDVVSRTSNILNNQPLLWYRLLPNSTYAPGVLLGLLLATAPLISVLIYRAGSNMWKLNLWQNVALFTPLLIFLLVGLVASTKIGGGADLHNMDMFFICLVFAASLMWERAGQHLVLEGGVNGTMRGALLLVVLLPVLSTLISMRPLVSVGNLETLKVFMGLENDPHKDPRIFGLLPAAADTSQALAEVQREVNNANRQGEVLFMDHRQLLTFGFVPNVPLVVDYEKKLLMDHALGLNARVFFEPFYKDLASHRFILIVTDPLRKIIKDSNYGFGEENDAWVKWVVNPILCYYYPKIDLEEFRVQLLVPRTDSHVCVLPE